MTPNVSPYQPIDCEFHDRLEAAALVRRPARIRFRDADGNARERTAAIADVFARNGEEFAALSTGETVRLDRILAIGEVLSPSADPRSCAR